MKVLFNTQQSAFQDKVMGGAEVQLLKTKEYLEKLGIKIKGFDSFNDKLKDYTIIHNFSMQRESFKLFDLAKKEGLKLALSSIYWPPWDLVFSDEPLKGIVKVFYEKAAMLKSNANPFYQLYPYKGYLDIADIILPNSQTEKEVIVKKFGVSPEKVFVVPNGVDKKYINSKPDLFFKKHKLKDFILFVGRIESRKNVLKLIKAVKQLDLELVIIGAPNPTQQNYYKLCEKEAENSKTHFLGSFQKDSEILISAYASAKVLALPSSFETPGLVALEAALAGCNIAITQNGSTKDYFGDLVDYCNPRKFNEIKNAIFNAYNKKKSNNLQNHVLKNFTWEVVAKKTLDAYKIINQEHK